MATAKRPTKKAAKPARVTKAKTSKASTTEQSVAQLLSISNQPTTQTKSQKSAATKGTNAAAAGTCSLKAATPSFLSRLLARVRSTLSLLGL